MLLSFKPEWYNRIKEGSKIFEYRRTFPDEEILAYMYVSSPMKMIVGKIHLGRKIYINTWKEEYKEDEPLITPETELIKIPTGNGGETVNEMI